MRSMIFVLADLLWTKIRYISQNKFSDITRHINGIKLTDRAADNVTYA